MRISAIGATDVHSAEYCTAVDRTEPSEGRASSRAIGEGHNIVKTMKGLSDRVADPEDGLAQIKVVDDQLGRLTFTRDMV